MGLKVISLMKQVPLPSEMRMGADGLMDRTKAKSIINVDCTFGLEEGLQIKKHVPNAELIVVSMGPPSFEQSLRQAISVGYDRAILLSDKRLGGSDTFATGYAIACLLKKLGFTARSKEPFVICAGRQTSDGDTAHVPSQVAENLGIQQATFVERVEWKEDHIIARRIIEGGFQTINVPLPCLVSMAPTAIPMRRSSLVGAMNAREIKIEQYGVDDIGANPDTVGLDGSPTLVARVVNIERTRPPVTMISGDTPNVLVDHLVTSVEESIKDESESGQSGEKETAASGQRPNIAKDYSVIDFRGDARGILTWVEVYGQTISRSSLELLNPARKLADDLKTKVTSVIIGNNVKDLASEIIAHGADEVIVVNEPRLTEYLILPTASIFAQIIKKVNPEIVLYSATTSGRELAPRVGTRVHSGVTADCTSLKIGEFVYHRKKTIMSPCLRAIRPTYGESKLATIVGFRCPQIATARPGTFEVPPADPERKGQITEVSPRYHNNDFDVEIIETSRTQGGASSLFQADIIVSGGRPCGELDDFKLVKKLVSTLRAKGLNADWGATRSAVDFGFAPSDRQIGQTGKTVRPKVYVSVAISGAIQHVMGMKESGKIISIDHNSRANIFKTADFGLVADYLQILPKLITHVENGFTFGLKK